MYKHHKIIGIRKVRWDELWHIMYKVRGQEAWDRVPMIEAMSVLHLI